MIGSAAGPISAVPLTTTHTDIQQKVISSPDTSRDRVVQEVTVVDVYDWRGVKSSVARTYTVDYLV